MPYDLKRSYEILGPLVPILADRDGNTIDGFHRKALVKDWPAVRLENVNDETKRLIVAIHANWHRRDVKKPERIRILTTLCELNPQWEKNGGYSNNLAPLIGFSPIYIRQLLPSQFKDQRQREKALAMMSIAKPFPSFTIYNVWNFPKCDPQFGQEGFPGRTPGQILENLLYYYTHEGDLVVDPMAGSGTTIDVCRIMRRRCLAYDIVPVREDIICNDIRKGFPKEASNVDLIFLDPPYWRLQNEGYTKLTQQSISALNYKEWLEVMGKLAKDCFSTARKGGYVALLVEAFLDEEVTGKFLDLPFKCLALFEEAGFLGVQRISVPMPPQVKSVQAVEYAKQKMIMLDLNRDLIIFKKE